MNSNSENLIDLHKIGGAVEVVDDLPRARWGVIDAWINQHVDIDERDAARCEAARQWLARLADHLGEQYWVGGTERFILLTSQEVKAAAELLRLADKLLESIDGILGRLVEDQPRRSWGVLLLANVEDYFTYVHHFYPEGESGGSAGMYIADGYPHIALTQGWAAGMVLSHELTHAYLGPLKLPLWVEEGLARIIEKVTTERQAFTIDHERAAGHGPYWQEHGLQSFWSGAAFSQTGLGQELAYELAEILVHNIMADHRDGFLEFLQNASAADAGEQAACYTLHE